MNDAATPDRAAADATPATPATPTPDVAAPPGELRDVPSRLRVRAAARRRARFGRRLAAAVWKDPFRAVPADRPLVRFLRGFMLPIGLLRATVGDPDRRRQWFRVCALQTVVVVAVGGAIGLQPTVGEVRSYAFGENGKIHVDLSHLSIFVALAYVEWCVIALSRQHHDAIGRAASVAAGVPPEDPPRTPRVALDLRWAVNKGKRRWRAFKAWSAGTPPLAVFAMLPWAGSLLFQVLLATWTAFWIACGAAAKTAYAWRSEGAEGAPEPFFLHGAAQLVERVPLFRWWFPRLYLRAWRSLTQGLFPPIREVEARGYEFAGLAAARVLFGLPLVYLFVRPFFPVASADLILRGLTAPRGAGARIDRPSLGALDRLSDLVVAPTSREALALKEHRDKRDD